MIAPLIGRVAMGGAARGKWCSIAAIRSTLAETYPSLATRRARPAFVAAQLMGGMLAYAAVRVLYPTSDPPSRPTSSCRTTTRSRMHACATHAAPDRRQGRRAMTVYRDWALAEHRVRLHTHAHGRADLPTRCCDQCDSARAYLGPEERSLPRHSSSRECPARGYSSEGDVARSRSGPELPVSSTAERGTA